MSNKRDIDCPDCGKTRRYGANGLCQACYIRRRRIEGKDRRRIVECKQCGEAKPHQARGLCDLCYSRTWAAENREYVSAYQREYQKVNKEKKAAYNRIYQKGYYQENKQRILDKSRQVYQRRRGAKLARAREWDRTHRENKRQAWKRWSCRKRGNTPLGQGLTIKDWQEILECYGRRCAYCGTQEGEITQDHVIPVSRGGPDTKENVVPACKSCNSQKSDKTPEEWGKWPSRSW